MKGKNIEKQQKLPIDEDDHETQRQIKENVKKWWRITCYLGLALVVTAGSWFLFFPGQPFHFLWQTWGRLLAVASLCILLPWLYAAATTLNLWLYGANLRRIDEDFASGKGDKWVL
jgi:hypothetical protein